MQKTIITCDFCSKEFTNKFGGGFGSIFFNNWKDVCRECKDKIDKVYEELNKEYQLKDKQHSDEYYKKSVEIKTNFLNELKEQIK